MRTGVSVDRTIELESWFSYDIWWMMSHVAERVNIGRIYELTDSQRLKCTREHNGVSVSMLQGVYSRYPVGSNWLRSVPENTFKRDLSDINTWRGMIKYDEPHRDTSKLFDDAKRFEGLNVTLHGLREQYRKKIMDQFKGRSVVASSSTHVKDRDDVGRGWSKPAFVQACVERSFDNESDLHMMAMAPGICPRSIRVSSRRELNEGYLYILAKDKPDFDEDENVDDQVSCDTRCDATELIAEVAVQSRDLKTVRTFRQFTDDAFDVNDVSKDVSDYVTSLLGSSVHGIMLLPEKSSPTEVHDLLVRQGGAFCDALSPSTLDWLSEFDNIVTSWPSNEDRDRVKAWIMSCPRSNHENIIVDLVGTCAIELLDENNKWRVLMRMESIVVCFMREEVSHAKSVAVMPMIVSILRSKHDLI